MQGNSQPASFPVPPVKAKRQPKAAKIAPAGVTADKLPALANASGLASNEQAADGSLAARDKLPAVDADAPGMPATKKRATKRPMPTSDAPCKRAGKQQKAAFTPATKVVAANISSNNISMAAARDEAIPAHDGPLRQQEHPRAGLSATGTDSRADDASGAHKDPAASRGRSRNAFSSDGAKSPGRPAKRKADQQPGAQVTGSPGKPSDGQAQGPVKSQKQPASAAGRARNRPMVTPSSPGGGHPHSPRRAGPAKGLVSNTELPASPSKTRASDATTSGAASPSKPGPSPNGKPSDASLAASPGRLTRNQTHAPSSSVPGASGGLPGAKAKGRNGQATAAEGLRADGAFSTSPSKPEAGGRQTRAGVTPASPGRSAQTRSQEDVNAAPRGRGQIASPSKSGGGGPPSVLVKETHHRAAANARWQKHRERLQGGSSPASPTRQKASDTRKHAPQAVASGAPAAGGMPTDVQYDKEPNVRGAAPDRSPAKSMSTDAVITGITPKQTLPRHRGPVRRSSRTAPCLSSDPEEGEIRSEDEDAAPSDTPSVPAPHAGQDLESGQPCGEADDQDAADAPHTDTPSEPMPHAGQDLESGQPCEKKSGQSEQARDDQDAQALTHLNALQDQAASQKPEGHAVTDPVSAEGKAASQHSGPHEPDTCPASDAQIDQTPQPSCVPQPLAAVATHEQPALASEPSKPTEQPRENTTVLCSSDTSMPSQPSQQAMKQMASGGHSQHDTLPVEGPVGGCTEPVKEAQQNILAAEHNDAAKQAGTAKRKSRELAQLMDHHAIDYGTPQKSRRTQTAGAANASPPHSPSSDRSRRR